MTIVFNEPGVALHHGDCIEVMRTLPDNSVHAVVTDPPYGLEFMGREWDGADGFRRSLNEADAGRDSVFGRTSKKAPEYKTGRPVILGQISDGDRSKGPLPTGPGTNSRGYADHDANAFQAWCEEWAREAYRVLKPGGYMLAFGASRTWHRLAVAIEDAGFEIRDSIAWLYGQGMPKGKNLDGEWTGWGTVLKPSFEPISVSRKPFKTSVAVNMNTHRTGALNIDASRVPMSAEDAASINAKHAGMDVDGYERKPGVSLNLSVNPMALKAAAAHEDGRWPTNVLLTHSPDCGDACVEGCPVRELGPAGRIFPAFRYEAKATGAERPEVDGVEHPTVKPLDLMRWLCALVTTEGGTILEPFAGSGTTLEAALLEGFQVIGIEREADYLPLIEKRITKPLQVAMFGDWDVA